MFQWWTSHLTSVIFGSVCCCHLQSRVCSKQAQINSLCHTWTAPNTQSEQLAWKEKWYLAAIFFFRSCWFIHLRDGNMNPNELWAMMFPDQGSWSMIAISSCCSLNLIKIRIIWQSINKGDRTAEFKWIPQCLHCLYCK